MKTKFPYNEVLAVANELANELRPGCKRIEVVGSVRRKKIDPSDVEILYIPSFENRVSAYDMFLRIDANLADDVIERLENVGVLKRRINSKGSEVFGSKNKLMVHVVSGIPIDLFSTTAENWWMSLVVRTGPKELNLKIAMAAQRHGFRMNAYGCGFTNLNTGEVRVMTSEADIFEFVGLHCLPPEKRG